MDELRSIADDLELEYEVDGNNFVIRFESFRDKFELICKPKEKWTVVIKLKNGKYVKKYCFYNKRKLRSYISCQYVLECCQLA